MSSTTSATPIFWVGLDVHKDSVTAAVFRNRQAEPMRVDRLPNDHKRIRRYFQRLSAAGAPRVYYETSIAGYVLQRAFDAWGIPCDLTAPSLIPRRRPFHINVFGVCDRGERRSRRRGAPEGKARERR